MNNFDWQRWIGKTVVYKDNPSPYNYYIVRGATVSGKGYLSQAGRSINLPVITVDLKDYKIISQK